MYKNGKKFYKKEIGERYILISRGGNILFVLAEKE